MSLLLSFTFPNCLVTSQVHRICMLGDAFSKSSSLFPSLPPSQRTVLTEADTDNKSEYSTGAVSKATRSLNRSLCYLVSNATLSRDDLASCSFLSILTLSFHILFCDTSTNAFSAVCDKVVLFRWPHLLVHSSTHTVCVLPPYAHRWFIFLL